MRCQNASSNGLLSAQVSRRFFISATSVTVSRALEHSANANTTMAFLTAAPISIYGGATRSGVRCARSRVAFKVRPTRAHGARMTAAAPTGGIEAAWAPFAERMKELNASPEVSEWNALLDVAVTAGDPPAKAIWVLETMRSTGRAPTAETYQRVLQVCAMHSDRAAAFHLVEHMWKDNVLIGDVELPDGMEDVLRTILPPEAFD